MTLLSKHEKKGFREAAKYGKSFGIPYFKPNALLFYSFRDSRHTVSTCTYCRHQSAYYRQNIAYFSNVVVSRQTLLTITTQGVHYLIYLLTITITFPTLIRLKSSLLVVSWHSRCPKLPRFAPLFCELRVVPKSCRCRRTGSFSFSYL